MKSLGWVEVESFIWVSRNDTHNTSAELALQREPLLLSHPERWGIRRLLLEYWPLRHSYGYSPGGRGHHHSHSSCLSTPTQPMTGYWNTAAEYSMSPQYCFSGVRNKTDEDVGIWPWPHSSLPNT